MWKDYEISRVRSLSAHWTVQCSVSDFFRCCFDLDKRALATLAQKYPTWPILFLSVIIVVGFYLLIAFCLQNGLWSRNESGLCYCGRSPWTGSAQGMLLENIYQETLLVGVRVVITGINELLYLQTKYSTEGTIWNIASYCVFTGSVCTLTF